MRPRSTKHTGVVWILAARTALVLSHSRRGPAKRGQVHRVWPAHFVISTLVRSSDDPTRSSVGDGVAHGPRRARSSCIKPAEIVGESFPIPSLFPFPSLTDTHSLGRRLHSDAFKFAMLSLRLPPLATYLYAASARYVTICRLGLDAPLILVCPCPEPPLSESADCLTRSTRSGMLLSDVVRVTECLRTRTAN